MLQPVQIFGGMVQKQGKRESTGISEVFAYVSDPDGYAIEIATQAILYQQFSREGPL